jgi:hypothetical protein
VRIDSAVCVCVCVGVVRRWAARRGGCSSGASGAGEVDRGYLPQSSALCSRDARQDVVGVADHTVGCKVQPIFNVSTTLDTPEPPLHYRALSLCRRSIGLTRVMLRSNGLIWRL